MTFVRTILLVSLYAFGVGTVEAQSQPGRTYAPGAFERIILDGAAQVRLSQGSKDEVFVVGDDEVQEAVDVRLSGNRLVIHPTGNWKFWNKDRLQVSITMRSLTQLIISGASDVHAAGPFKAESLTVHISGSGLVRFDELSAKELRFNVSGAGDGQIVGQVDDMSLNLSGKGKMLADQLRAARARVNISGVGNAQLWVTESLRVNISGVGTVDYWGQPQVSRHTAGLGTINARGDKR
jgi:hypothetical protein